CSSDLRVFLSWGNFSPYHPVVEWIHRLTEPVLAPIRNLMPPMGMFDWSPIIAIFVLMILRQVVVMLFLGP
ncbi:MAG TPA: YggT family protein, partial [Armatimonadetes bacterium]|nr:YggT family protein [Armatimonadota bacterium]